MSMRTRGTSTRAPPPPPASPRHASSRRAAGCGNEPSRCLNFCHALRVYERSLGSWKVFAVVDIEYERCTLRLLPVRFVFPRFLQLPAQPLASFSCAYKREVAPLRETHQNYFFLSPPVPEHCAAATIFSIPACGVHRRSGQ